MMFYSLISAEILPICKITTKAGKILIGRITKECFIKFRKTNGYKLNKQL